MYGGNCQVFTRYAKIESKDVLLIDLDENNLYGHSQSTPLPYGKPTYYTMESSTGRKKCEKVLKSFNNVSREQQLFYEPNERYTHKILHRKGASLSNPQNNKTNEVPLDPYGFTGFMKVHLSYTKAQKRKVKHFPPLPERRKIDEKEYSTYMNNILKEIEEQTQSKKSKSVKLVYDLSDKDQYCIYSEYLKFLLEYDMITLNAVYQLVEYKIGYVMRPFITDTTNNRQKAEDDMKEAKNDADMADAKSRKAFYKLFGNSVSGKTFQNDLKFHDTTFVRNRQQFLKATVGRFHMDNVIIGQNLVEVKCKKKKYEIRSPK